MDDNRDFQEGDSLRDLTAVVNVLGKAKAEASIKESMASMSADQMQNLANTLGARVEVQRQLALTRTGGVIPGGWPVKKRLAVMKYVGKCIAPLDEHSLQALDDGALSTLVQDAGQGYDAYLKRKMNGLKVRYKDQS